MKKIFIVALIPNLLAQPILANTIIQKLSDHYEKYVNNKIENFAKAHTFRDKDQIPHLDFGTLSFSLFPGYCMTNEVNNIWEGEKAQTEIEAFLSNDFNPFLAKLKLFKKSEEIKDLQEKIKNTLNTTYLNKESQGDGDTFIYNPNIFTGAPGFYLKVTKESITFWHLHPDLLRTQYNYLKHFTVISGIVGLSLYSYKRQTSTKNKQLLKNQTPTKMNIKKVLSQEAQLPLNQKS